MPNDDKFNSNPLQNAEPSTTEIVEGSNNACEKRDLDSKQFPACLDSSTETINSGSTHNLQEVTQFLQCTHVDRPRYLVAFHPHRVGSSAHRIAGDDSGLVAWLSAHNEWNIYFSVNEPKPSFSGDKKCSKGDIQIARFLHVDVDPRAGEDVESERSRIFHLLTDRLPEGVKPPTCLIDSGGGFQALWLLREPQVVGDDADALAEVEGRSRWLESRLSADSCHNIDRVLRLPGTVNWPNAKKRAKGRLARRAKLVFWSSDRVYDLKEFPMSTKNLAKTSGRLPTVAISNRIANLSTVDDLPLSVPDRIKVIIVHGRNPDEPPKAGDDSRSAWLFDAVCRLVRAGCEDEMIFAAITDPAWLISESVLDKGANFRAYALRQIEKAREAVANDKAGSVQPRWVAVRENKATGELVPIPSYENTRLAIRALGVETRHDVFHDRKLLGGHAIGRHVGELSDEACLFLRSLIFDAFRWEPKKEHVLDAAVSLCIEGRFDPVCDYIDGLTWDGVQRLDSLCVKYLRADDNDLNAAIGRKLLIAAIRRAKQPGCKFDYVPVFEGPQGCGKSTAVRILAGDEFFSDKGVLHLEDRAQQEAVKGVWLYELAELAGLGKKDVNRIKAFVSQQDDRGRAAFARFVTTEKRRCVFIGTTNDAEYLLDTTGNRRFWPLAVGQIDLVALRLDRDQLWAEAAVAEKCGESLEIPSSLWTELAERQSDRMQGGDWADILAHLYGERCGNEFRISSQQCYDAVGVEKDQWRDYRVAENLKRAMSSLGWSHHGKFRIGGRPPVRGFSRSIEAHEKAYRRYGPKQEHKVF